MNDKETLLMIPGTLCDDLLFQSQIDGLKDIANCKVVDHKSSDKLEEQARQIIQNAKSDTFSVFGLSYGGIIAFEIWRQTPKKINRLILANTTYKLPTSTTIKTLKKFVSMVGQGKFKEITSNILKDLMLHPDNNKISEIRQTVLQMAINVGEKGYLNQIKAQLGRPDSTNNLSNIECPTLLLVGDKDIVCPVVLHEEMKEQMPNATLKVIKDSGHLSTIEQPQKVNEAIKKWWLNRLN